MNILLTGGMGYLGSHTAIVLMKAGHRVIIFDNLCNSRADVLDRLVRIAGQKIPFVEGDVKDKYLPQKILRDYSIDAVIHFAGLKSVSESVEKPIDYFENNIEGAINLLGAMAGENVKTLVFSSSATVYGEPKYVPVNENHPTRVTNPYGRSKLCVEEILNDIAGSDPGWRIACLRYFNPVGAHDSGLIGEMSKGAPNNLVPLIVQVAAGRRPMLKVFGNDYPTKDGTGVRDYIHVMDLATGHLAALDYLSERPGWHEFNLGTGRGYSVLEMIRAFESVCGRPIPFEYAPRRIGDVPYCYADPKKAEAKLKWFATRNLKDMCLSAWNFEMKSTPASNCHSQ
jgi:UDP-glucose 4-epimerase